MSQSTVIFSLTFVGCYFCLIWSSFMKILNKVYCELDEGDWINEINQLIKINKNEAMLDIRLTGVTFSFHEECRQTNLATIARLGIAVIGLRQVGKTGLDVTTWTPRGAYIGSIGWIPKQVAHSFVGVLDHSDIIVERFQIAQKHIITEEPSIVNLVEDIDSLNKKEYRKLMMGLNNSFVMSAKLRFRIYFRELSTESELLL